MRGRHLLLAALTALTTAAPNCLLRGPAFPKPTSLSTHPLILSAGQNLTAGFDALLLNTTSVVVANNSWSLEAFSVHDDSPAFWTNYHTALNLEEVNSTGTREVDGTSLYRLGSVTKIFTVLTWLAELGDEHWFVPITRYVPELREIMERSDLEDPVRYIDWDVITIGALAGQMSGIPRDYALLGELTQDYGGDLVYVGFPPPEKLAETPTCGLRPLCNRTAFFDGLEDMMPTFAPEEAPGYSNVAYILLAYALEEITGKDWLSLLTDNILTPLGLEDTFYTTPNDTSRGVIPGNASTTGWYNHLGDEGPAGSMFSSSNDITRLSKAILASELTTREVTSRWLRPISFTSDPQAALGAPWGVRRINMGQEYHWIYGYQKAGRIADYSALMILIPDYDIGFTLLTGGDMPVNMNFDFADFMGAQLIPAVHAAAREQAREAYAGEYHAADTSLNSSITIGVDEQAGLSVERWISNGTDMAQISVMLMISSPGPVNPRIRLFPTQLETLLENGNRRVVFRATLEDADGDPRVGRLFSTDCASWLTASSQGWAARSIDGFVFELDGDTGEAISVEPVALRAVLVKGGEPYAGPEVPEEEVPDEPEEVPDDPGEGTPEDGEEVPDDAGEDGEGEGEVPEDDEDSEDGEDGEDGGDGGDTGSAGFGARVLDLDSLLQAAGRARV